MSGGAEFIVDSATGIDVALPVAGPGARSYAFIIDWHIRLVLALAWYAGAALLYSGRLTLAAPLASDTRWFTTVLAPALAIYFLYHPVVELALRGSTPGKRMAGVRIVNRHGAAPGAGAVLIRNVFRLIDSLPLCYGVGLVSVAMTAEHLRIGDLAAGTLLVYERPAPAPAGAAALGTARDPAAAEVAAELLQRWPQLLPEARIRLARALLAAQADGAGTHGADDRYWQARLRELLRSGGVS
ncbi:MAG: RDD family protein [Proteobacteria bacterium]|nr:RDD family protein [Pseudomonadota bacterium]